MEGSYAFMLAYKKKKYIYICIHVIIYIYIHVCVVFASPVQFRPLDTYRPDAWCFRELRWLLGRVCFVFLAGAYILDFIVVELPHGLRRVPPQKPNS